MSIGMYFYADTQLTIVEAIAAGFGALAGILVGLIGAVVGIVLGLLGALIGLVAAGGAVAVTLFIIGSPIIAIILLVLLMRRPKADCPNPDAHQ